MDILFVSLFKNYVLNKNARRLAMANFGTDEKPNSEVETKFESITIEAYQGSNPHCLKMMDFVRDNLERDLIGAIVHGSIGSGEEIGYSDFDGLLIIKDEVLRDPKRLASTAKKIMASRRILYEFDPLQHHDWFLLTEKDFDNYPESYFPHELFYYSKLLSNKEVILKIKHSERKGTYIKQFIRLSDRIITKIEDTPPKNVYQLKGLLSECMLMPALYVQAKTGKGIFKKSSFTEARKDFSKETWQVMDEISQIREDWSVYLNKMQYLLLTSINPILRGLGKKISPKIPEKIMIKLCFKFYERISGLIAAMKTNISDAN